MYLEHFGLTEAPFKITPHTEFFFAGAKRGETLDALIYAIMAGEGIVKVTGEVGAGKTMLCRVLMERLPDTVETIYLAVPTLTRDEMLAVIAGDLDIDSNGISTTKLIRALQQRLIDIHAEGKHVVALIDEAHAMPLLTLEELRLLSNLETSQHKLMQIVMFGQPELDLHLALPSMRQLKERITHSFNLLPLPARDIKDYLSFRLRAAGYRGPDLFSAESLKLITEASEGLTRRINIYADKSLLAAYAEDTHTVTPDHVRAAIADTQIGPPPTKSAKKQWLIALAALLIGLALGSAIGYWLGRSTPGVVQITPPAAMPTALPNQSVPMPAEATVEISNASQPNAATPAQSPISSLSTTTTSPTATNTATTASITAPMPAMPSSTTTAIAIVSAAKSMSTATPALRPAPITPLNATDKQLATGKAATPNSTVAPKTGITTAPDFAAPDWLSARINADRERMASILPSHYTIQLMTAGEGKETAIEEFWQEASRELSAGPLLIYPRGTNEKPYVSILFGDFETLEIALNEANKLSSRLKKFQPYARSYKAVRQDLRQ